MAQQNDDEKEEKVELSDAAREEFNDAFKLFDKDGDGVITTQEIYDVFEALNFTEKTEGTEFRFTKDDVKKMVQAVDLDGNGTIDLDEFIALLREQGKQNKGKKGAKMSAEDELKKAFAVFDTDVNGDIDADELSKIMQALGENLSKQDIEFMIKSVDLDGNKAIDFEEFKKNDEYEAQ